MVDVGFRLDEAGLVEVCKSGGMRSALMDAASKIASAANAAARGHEKALHVSEFKVPPYAAHVDVLARTAVGAAHTNSKMGRLDEAKFKSLSRQNH